MSATGTQVDYGTLADVVREEIAREGFIANSCILAARLLSIVLGQLGVSGVEVMACDLEAFSPAYVAMRMLADDHELSEPEVDKFIALGAWRVTASDIPALPGMVDNRNAYNGHVVTLVERRWLIDPTLPAASRPHKQLVIDPPYAWEFDYEQACASGIGRRMANETIVIHRFRLDRQDFRRAQDWQRPAPGDPIVRRIITRLSTEGSRN